MTDELSRILADAGWPECARDIFTGTATVEAWRYKDGAKLLDTSTLDYIDEALRDEEQ